MTYKIVRTTKTSNFEEIKNVYYQTWNYSYRGLVPNALLDNLDRENTWHPEIRWNNTLVAMTDDQKIIGVCTFGPARRKKYSGFGEIYSIYVLPTWQHHGIGQRLFQQALNLLQNEYEKMYLIVLKNNLSAQAFYELFGFEETTDHLAEQTAYGLLHEVVFQRN